MSDRATGKRLLVIAHWEEDLDWIDDVPDEWTCIVIEKGVDIKNEGREASSYFLALERLYDVLTPDDTIAFVQGNPFAHCDWFIERLSGPIEGFTWLGDWVLHCDLNGAPNHPGLPLREGWRDWIGGDPPEEFEFSAGAQFAMPASLVFQHDKRFYADMILAACNEDERAPWVLERLWQYIFKGSA